MKSYSKGNLSSSSSRRFNRVPTLSKVDPVDFFTFEMQVPEEMKVGIISLDLIGFLLLSTDNLLFKPILVYPKKRLSFVRVTNAYAALKLCIKSNLNIILNTFWLLKLPIIFRNPFVLNQSWRRNELDRYLWFWNYIFKAHFQSVKNLSIYLLS